MNLFIQFICVFIFGMSCWALGDWLLIFSLRGSRAIPSLARHTLAFSAGNVAFSYLLTALGFAGLFISPALWGVFLAGAGLAVYRMAANLVPQTLPVVKNQKWPKKDIYSSCEPIQESGGQWASIIFWGIVLVFLLPAVLQAAAPPYVRDSLVYHLLCPKEYLKASGLIHIEGNLFSAFPKGHEVLMTLLLATAGDRAAQAFSLLQHIAIIGGLFSLTRLIGGSWAAGICTLGYATVPPAIYFTGCGYVEPALLMALGSSLLALAFFLRISAEGSKSRKLSLRQSALVGFLAGWMPALKYTGIIYLGLVGFLLLWSQRKEPAGQTLKAIAVFTIGAAPGLCWLVWNWMNLGNPVYPLAFSFFGGKGWDEIRERAFSLYFLSFGMGREGWDYLLLPWRFSFSGRFDSVQFDGAMGPLLLIFLILAVVSSISAVRGRVNKSLPAGMGFVLFASAAIFVLGNQQARFWLPAQLLACFYAAPAVELIYRWAKRGLMAKLAIGLVVIVSLSWNGWFLGKQVAAVGYYKPALGLEEESSFLKRIVPGYPAIEFINRHVPASSRVFCVWTGAYTYYLDRPYYSDTFLEDMTFKRLIDTSNDGAQLAERLDENGFTHLFVRRSLLDKSLIPRQLEIFDNFLRDEARELFRHRDFSVFAIPLKKT